MMRVKSLVCVVLGGVRGGGGVSLALSSGTEAVSKGCDIRLKRFHPSHTTICPTSGIQGHLSISAVFGKFCFSVYFSLLKYKRKYEFSDVNVVKILEKDIFPKRKSCR